MVRRYFFLGLETLYFEQLSYIGVSAQNKTDR